MICRLIVAVICMATCFSFGTIAWSGEIAPELLKELEGSGSAHEYAVIIKLRDAVDYQSLKASVEQMARRERVKKVVQEIKAATGPIAAGPSVASRQPGNAWQGKEHETLLDMSTE